MTIEVMETIKFGAETTTPFDTNVFDMAAMRASYAGGAAAWSDDEVYADYTTYRGPAPRR